MFTTRAAIGDGQGNITIEIIEVGWPKPGEVLVDIRASGICHTDWDSKGWGRPLVLGHEGAGSVRLVGSAVTHVKPGDRVILNWAIPCGDCFQCQCGNHALCETSRPAYTRERSAGAAHAEGTLRGGVPIDRSFNLGTLSGLTLVRAEAVTKLPDHVPFAVGAIVGCGVMTGYGSVVNAAKVRPGASVVVLGAGGVGLSAVQGARISGAAKIIVVERRPTRLAAAKHFGATHIIEAGMDDPELLFAAAKVKALLDGRGADYCFESTAVPGLGAAPLAFVRNGGIAVQMSGIEQRINFDMELFEWDKTYINPLYGQCRPAVDFPRMFELYAKGALLLDEMITRTYALDELSQALDDMLQGRNCKGVVLFGESTL